MRIALGVKFMAGEKYIKAHCKKTKKFYCIEVQQVSADWKAVNFVNLTDDEASVINTEVKVNKITTSQHLIPCFKCNSRSVAGCSCATKSKHCMTERYYFQCIYCNELAIDPGSTKVEKIYVTSPNYDTIGEVLKSMGVPFQPFSGNLDCDILFINCGTPDSIDPQKLNNYVKNGGCVYASDLTDTIIDKAFPGYFNFGGHRGETCKIFAEVIDSELKQIVGREIEIEFDLGNWALLSNTKGTVLLRAAQGNKYAGLPIMAQITYGNGTVFYTCFHNHVQASEKEKMLLQLLLLKQMSTNAKTSVEQMGSLLGINLSSMKERFMK